MGEAVDSEHSSIARLATGYALPLSLLSIELSRVDLEIVENLVDSDVSLSDAITAVASDHIA